MQTEQMIKQMLDYNKTIFDYSFDTAVRFQDQAETLTNGILDQNPWLPAEGRKMMDQWVAAAKKGRDEFKSGIDAMFDQAEAYVAPAAKKTATSRKKA